MFALERMVQVMEMTQAGMVYADHYQQIDGVQKTAPVIDYQPGSLRDDFNFGSVLLFNANAFKEVIENTEEEYYLAVQTRFVRQRNRLTGQMKQVSEICRRWTARWENQEGNM